MTIFSFRSATRNRWIDASRIPGNSIIRGTSILNYSCDWVAIEKNFQVKIRRCESSMHSEFPSRALKEFQLRVAVSHKDTGTEGDRRQLEWKMAVHLFKYVGQLQNGLREKVHRPTLGDDIMYRRDDHRQSKCIWFLWWTMQQFAEMKPKKLKFGSNTGVIYVLLRWSCWFCWITARLGPFTVD